MADPRLRAIPRSVNDEIADRAIRHLMFLTRLQNAEAQKMVALFNTAVVPDVLSQLDKRLAVIAAKGFDPGPATTARLQRLAAGIDKITNDFAKLATKESSSSLLDVAKSEVGFESGLIKSVLPVKVEMALPSIGLMQQIVKAKPFNGKVLGDWWTGLGNNTRDGIMQQVRVGLVNGESSTQIAARLRTNSFVKGRANAQAVAHTAVISTSANAREEVYKANADLIKSVRWVSTLDNRTCVSCGSLDGQVFPVGEGPRPPDHVSCRCTTVPVTKSFREMGFDVDDLDPGTRASMNGQVPADMTYNQWLKGQSVAVQNEALGVGKAKLFRKGGLPVKNFVNNGKVLSLGELEALEADVFEAAFGRTAVTKAAKLSAAELAASKEIVKIAEGGKGLFVKNKAFKQLTKEGVLEGITAQEQLLKVTDQANALQAAATLSSKLSTAKKKLIAGKKISPSEQGAVDALTGETAADFAATVKAGQDQIQWQGNLKATLSGQFDTTQNSFVAQQTKVALGELDPAKLNADEIKAIVRTGKAESEAQATFTKKYVHSAADSPEATAVDLLNAAPGADDLSWVGSLAKADELLEGVLKKQADEAAAALKAAQAVQIKKINSAIAETADLPQPIAKQILADANLGGVDLAGKSVNELTKAADDLLAAIEKAKAAPLKQAAEQSFTHPQALKFFEDIDNGIALKKDIKAFQKLHKQGVFGEFIGYQQSIAEAAQLVKAEAAVTQAAATKAAKLSTAKKKLAQGKKPSPNEQIEIDALLPSEKATFDEAVAKLVGDKDSAALAAKRSAAASDDILLGDDLTNIGAKPGGSVAGYLARHRGTGEKWIVKTPASDDIARNEVLAAKLYRAAGVDVPEVRLIKFADGRQGVASKFIDGIEVNAAKLKDLAKQGADAGLIHDNFAVDAWLSNWDVVGEVYDNLVFGPGGRVLRIDVGGALRYRAQGSAKGDAFGRKVGEITSLRSPSNRQAMSIFTEASQEQIEAGVRKVLAISDDEIRAVVNKYGPEDDLVRAQLIDDLIGRKNDLRAQFPNAAKQRPKAPGPVGDEVVTEFEIERIVDSRQNGYMLPVDKDQLEDQGLLVNIETALNGKKTTVVNGKLRGAAGDRLTKEVRAAGGDVPRFDDGGTFDDMLTAFKGVGAQASKSAPLRAVDIERSQAALATHLRARRKVEALVKSGDYDQAVLDQFDKHFAPYLEVLEKVTKLKDGDSTLALLTVTDADGFVQSMPFLKKFAPKITVKAADNKVEWVQRRGWRKKEIDKGFATQSSDDGFDIARGLKDTDGIEFYEANIEGVTVRYWPNDDRTLAALRNKVEVWADGESRASVEKALATLERLGINAKRATDLDREELYLRQIAWHLRDDYREFENVVTSITDQESRVRRMRELVSKRIGVDDVTAMEGYKYDGVQQAFETGRRVFLRPDFAGAEWDEFEKSHRLVHSLYNGVEEDLPAILNSGGSLVSSTEKLRRGIPLGGMSPSSDIGTGGADFVFTRIREASSAHRRSGALVFKSSHLRRLDAISYEQDQYGKADSLNFILDKRKNTIEEYKRVARFDGNETNFKGALSIFDDLDFIMVDSESQKKRVIEIIKGHINEWPDGRPLSEIVRVGGR